MCAVVVAGEAKVLGGVERGPHSGAISHHSVPTLQGQGEPAGPLWAKALAASRVPGDCWVLVEPLRARGCFGFNNEELVRPCVSSAGLCLICAISVEPVRPRVK